MDPEASAPVFEGAIFSVHRERWAGMAHAFEVVHHAGAAAVLPVTADDGVLLVEQFRPALRRTLLEIPAGLLDRDGEDALACAARELREETGYRHRSIEPLGAIHTSPGFTDELVQLFAAEVDARPEGEPEPAIALRRRGFNETLADVRAGRITDAKTVAAVLLEAARRSA